MNTEALLPSRGWKWVNWDGTGTSTFIRIGPLLHPKYDRFFQGERYHTFYEVQDNG